MSEAIGSTLDKAKSQINVPDLSGIESQISEINKKLTNTEVSSKAVNPLKMKKDGLTKQIQNLKIPIQE